MIEHSTTSSLITKISAQIEHKEIILPLLPNIVAKVFEVTSNPDSSARDISELVMTDQTLTVNILNMANSAYYFSGEKTTSLHHAVARLGFQTISNLIVTAALDSQFHMHGHYATLEANFWEHSLLTSFIAKNIAEKVRMDGEEAYLAGLIHDIGKTILLTIVNNAVKKMSEKIYPPHDGVEALFEKFHSYVGFLAAQKWKMSERVCKAISLHHHFEFAKKNKEFVALISLSNKLANSCENFSEFESSPESKHFRAEIKTLNISDKMMSAIVGDLYKVRSNVSQMVTQV